MMNMMGGFPIMGGIPGMPMGGSGQGQQPIPIMMTPEMMQQMQRMTPQQQQQYLMQMRSGGGMMPNKDMNKK